MIIEIDLLMEIVEIFSYITYICSLNIADIFHLSRFFDDHIHEMYVLLQLITSRHDRSMVESYHLIIYK